MMGYGRVTVCDGMMMVTVSGESDIVWCDEGDSVHGEGDSVDVVRVEDLVHKISHFSIKCMD